MFEGIGKWLSENPEKFAIMADTVGQNLAPDNAFAGVGTQFGQSSLANQAAKRQMEERKKMLGMLSTALGGGPVTPDVNKGERRNDSNGFSLMDGMDLSKLTAPDQPGPTSMIFKAGPDGTVTSTQQSTVAPSKAKQQPGVNLTDIAPFF